MMRASGRLLTLGNRCARLNRRTFQRMKPQMPLRRALSGLAIAAALATPVAPARALVGAAPDGRFTDRVAMVLMRGAGEAGFCSALVLDSRTLLTAAHCLRPVKDMAVHYRDASGAPVVIPVEAAVVHPRYRPAMLATDGAPAVGEAVILTGYGVTRDGDWKSGGQLRSVALNVREP